MSSRLLRRVLYPRAASKNLSLSPISSSTHSLSPPTPDESAVSTAVSVLTHHRSNSRWSTLLSLFPHGFTPPQISQILLRIRNNPHLALRFFHFTTRHSLSSPPLTLHSYATIIHVLARSRFKSRAQSLIKSAFRVSELQGVDDDGKSCKLFRALVETYRVCDSAPFVFDLLIKSLLEMNQIDPCIDIVRMLRSRGIYPNVSTCNALISTASRRRGCFFGYDLYKEVFGCNTNDSLDYDKHVKQGVSCKALPNVHTFNELMLSFCRNGLLDMVEEVWIDMVKLNCSPNSYSYNILMEAYCGIGEMEKAQNVWEELRGKGLNRDIVGYNTLIGAYCKKGEVEKGEELYREMVLGGVEGSCVTYCHLVNGYCLVGDAENAMVLCKDMHRKGFSLDCSTTNSMVRVLCNKRSVSEALAFFRTAMEKADFIATKSSYDYLIKGLCGEGKMEEALKLQAQMVGKGFRPNSHIYGAFIDGYIKQRNPDVAESLRKEMMTTYAQ